MTTSTPGTQPSRPPSRKPIVVFAAGVAVLALGAAVFVGYALAGGGDSEPSATPSTGAQSTPALPAAIQVECVNVERAYNAWNGMDSIKTAADVAALNEFTVERHVEDGEEFYRAVNGYKDKPALTLVLAIAEYNVELGFINLSLTLSGEITDPQQPGKVAAAAGKLRQAYAAFKRETCGA